MKKICRLLPLLLVLFNVSDLRAQNDSAMSVHYINVGQAAAVLLEFPCGAVMIDAGAQDTTFHRELIEYLAAFFARRTDLNNTISLLMITHPHIDHDEALWDIAHKFHVARYIDDGLRIGSGKKNQMLMQDSAKLEGIQYESFSFEEITKDGNKSGMTDSIIDPINCAVVDPKIILYSGQFSEKPANWTATDFKNYNNHSLVVKVLFGKASFLFTGDLETKGIKSLVDEYAGTDALDVDILMVGHHGAANATTEAYLDAVTPVCAVISCGQWDFGKGKSSMFTTFAYGHPRISTIDMLEERIPDARSQPVHVEAATGSRKFQFIDVDKRIYATPWDHNIVIHATAEGAYEVTTNN